MNPTLVQLFVFDVYSAEICEYWNTVHLIIFARFYFLRISRGGQIREFNLVLPIIEIDNSRILDIAKVPKSQIREYLNTRKFPDVQFIIDAVS